MVVEYNNAHSISAAPCGCGRRFMDGGYNYANFRYSGPEHMDSMWYFATWLANAIGSLLMRLPFGNTMLGMNVYTGLIVSIMATVFYFFCVKKLRIAAPVAFVGELTAIELCWAPTSALYNYLTYLFLLVATCFLYQGLVSGRVSWLVAALGVFLLGISLRYGFGIYVESVFACFG